MTDKDAADILFDLAEGRFPGSDESLPEGSVCHDVQVVRALNRAVWCLLQTGVESKRREGQGKQGAAWDEEEEGRLVEAFKAGEPMKEIAARHERTRGAIRSRLKKLGLVE